jgi:hypothetical protein
VEQVVLAVDAPIELPEVRASLTLSLAGYGSMSECCHSSAALGFMQVASCFDTENLYGAQLTPGLGFVTPGAANNSQYLFHLQAAGATAAPIWQSWTNAQQALEYSTQAEEYCFELLALDVRTLATHRYDALEPRCAPHGSLGALGPRPLSVSDAQLDRLICPTPPESLAARWCEVNERLCANNTTLQGCDSYGPVCHGELVPEPDLAGAGGVGGASVAGASGSGGAPSAGMGDESSSSGCSAALAQRSSAPVWVWSVLGLLALRARRTRNG